MLKKQTKLSYWTFGRVLLVGFASAFISAAVIYSSFSRFVDKTQSSIISNIANEVSYSALGEFIQSGNIIHVQEKLKHLRAFEGVKEAIVVNFENNMLITEDDTKKGNFDCLSMLPVKLSTENIKCLASAGVASAEKSIRIGVFNYVDQKAGDLFVMYDSIHVLRPSPISVITVLFIAIIIISFSFMIVRMILRNIVKPVEELANLFSSNDAVTSPCLRGSYKFKEIASLYHSLEEKCRNARLVSIGQSTAMVAHDVRKPLAGMKALLSSLSHLKDDPEQVDKMIASVDRSISQTNAMLNDVLEFSKDATSLVKSDVDPLAIIHSSLSDVFTSFHGGNGTRPDVTITYDLKHKNYLNVDSNRIVRVFVNIIGNAVEAMGGKGKVWIRTEDVDSDHPLSSAKGGSASGGNSLPSSPVDVVFGARERGGSVLSQMRITVGNDGPVIPEDVQQKLFEPFFTKGKKGGSGLGLSITQKIIDMHEGKISVSSKMENGENKTEFIIELAATQANLPIKEEDLIHHSDEFDTFIEEEKMREEHGETENTVEFMRLHKAHGKKFHLLIVDDEPLFRETVRTLVSSVHQIKDHVKIVEASSAEEGLSLFKAREFDYVITDIDMGKRNMNGYEMAEEILKKYSKTKVLVHSNKRRAEMDKDIRDIESVNFMGFLPKPMNQREVTQFLACRTFEAKKGAEVIEKRKNILVVNDDDEIQIMFKVLLKSRGVDILGASNVGDALTKLANNEFDVILADVNLGSGEPTGYDLLKKLKEDKTAAKVYMVSGYSADEEWPKAKELGADGYFQLPVDDAALKTILQ